MDLVEGSTASKTVEKLTSSVSLGGARYVEALATPRVMDHNGKEKNEENIWMMVKTWTNCNFIREPLVMSWP
jgi:hypothetical protein